jgi:MYXO-CTERM domain-containing protein
MTRTTLRTGLVLLTAGIGLSLGYVAPADAAYPAVLQLAPGIGGPKEKNGGPGHEQIHAAVFQKDGKQYVVSVYMSSNVDQNKDGYWQCKCSSVLMDPIVGPTTVQDQVQLTHNGGTRPCNHPRIASNGADYGVWTYGTNDQNGNTRTFVQGINEKCELQTKRLRISEDNNQNEGAPHIEFVGGKMFVAGYLSTANNANDAMYLVGVNGDNAGGTGTVEKTWITKTVAPSNIGRPAIVPAGADKVFACASKGNNRPPEDGVECALVSAIDGTVIHKQLIAKSDENAGIYYNQPTVARLSDNVFAVQVLESNGLGKKNKDLKGSNTPHLYVFQVSDASFSQMSYVDKVGAYPTHSAICGGQYGEKGDTYIAVMGASPTGLGQPGIQFVSYNKGAINVDKANDLWTVGFYGDSGRLSNLYGPNPNTQGRDFPLCIGNVKNPGFGVKNGYMADVETFFLAPHSGNNGVEPKNGAYISFVPGKTSAPVVPQPPQEQPKQGITATPDPGAGGDGGAGGGNGGNGGSGAGGNGDNPGAGGGSVSVSSPRAGACSVPSSGAPVPAETAFLALGAAALLVARRRK